MTANHGRFLEDRPADQDRAQGWAAAAAGILVVLLAVLVVGVLGAWAVLRLLTELASW